MKFISDIVESFYNNFDSESQNHFSTVIMNAIINEYGIDFIINILVDIDVKRRHPPIWGKTDRFYQNTIVQRRLEIKKEIEYKLRPYIREQKINQIL